MAKHPNTLAAFCRYSSLRLGLSVLLALMISTVLLLLPLMEDSARPISLANFLEVSFDAATVQAAGGLTITKTAPATVNQGEILTYTILVNNNTGQDIIAASVADAIPQNTTCNSVQDSSPPIWAKTSCGSGAIAWVLIQSPPFFTTPFTNNTTALFNFSVAVNQPLPDQSVIINDNYNVSASPFSDIGAAVTTTVNAPNWEISKTASSSIVQPGDRLTYTLTITNNGHFVTSGTYTITDEIPANTTFVSASAPGTFSAGNVTWALNTPLNVNQSTSLTYAVTINQNLADELAIVNQNYSVTGGNVFSPAFGSAVTITVDVPVTLTLTKVDVPDPVQAGDILTYTLTVTNDASSKGPAGSIVITDTIPANTSLVEAGFINPAAGITITSGSVVTWTLTSPNPLPLNQTAELFMAVRVTSPLTNNTVITNNIYNVTASNGQVTVLGQPTVTTTVESLPILEISKVGLPAEVTAGGLLTYTISFTNSGNANATNLLISDTFPTSTTFNSETVPLGVVSTSTLEGRQWGVDFLAGEGGSGFFVVTLNVLSPQAPGTLLTNTVSISSSEALTPVLAIATNTITSTPQLHVRKTADPSPVAVGSILTYTITFSNTGNANALNAVITDLLDSNVTFNGATEGGTHSNGVVTWTGLTAPAGGLEQSITFSVTVASNLPNNSTLTNTVQFAAANVVTTSSTTTLVQAPSLTVTKTVSPSGVVRAGDNIEYTITYTNTGAITITLPGIRITDTIPVSITNIVSSSVGATFQSAAPPPYVWTEDQLPPDGSGSITISGQVITSPWASTGGQITNDVVVAGSGYSATTSISNEGRPGLPFTITLIALPSSTPVGNNIVVNAIVQDVYGNDVFDGTAITLTTSLSGSRLNGSASPVVVNTANGAASANLTSTLAGTSTIQAQVAGANNPITRTTVVTFTPGPVAGFVVQATSPQTAGIAFPITVTAVDAFGNTVTTFQPTIALTDTTRTINNTTIDMVNGVGTRNIVITQATSPNLDFITVISPTGGAPITGTVGVEILPNVPNRLQVTVAPATTQVCGSVNVTATLTDAFNNPNPNHVIDLSLITGGGGNGILSPLLGATNAAGIFNSTLQAISAGTVRVQGVLTTPVNLTNQSSAITISNPPIPTTLSLSVSPDPLATGGNIAAVTANVTDCIGFSVGQPVQFSVSNPTLAFLPSNPITRTTNSTGVATTTLTSNSIPQDGVVVVTATVGSLVQTTTVTLVSPNIAITKTANPASGTEVRPGQSINYTLQVNNGGTGFVSGLVITDALPAGVSFASCTTSAGTCTGGSTTRINVPTLNAGQSLTATLQVTVTAATSGTVISNTAVARSAQTSLITSNVVAHAVTTATVDLFLPIVLNNFTPISDLRITNFTVTGTDPNRVVTIVVENGSSFSTGEGFWVDFYVNPSILPNNPNLGGNRRWELTGSAQGIAWAIPALSPGQSVTLTSNGAPGTVAPAAPPLSNWTGTLPAGANQLYAFVDSFDAENAPYGEILESDESNNMASLVVTAANDVAIEPAAVPDLDNLPPRWNP